VPEHASALAGTFSVTGFYSAHGEMQVHDMREKRISIAIPSAQSLERRRHQKQCWFRKGQKWRTGSEGRISVLK
jgi:IS5 family transposase